MTSGRNWQLCLIVLLMLVCATSVVGCATKEERNIDSYLSACDPIVHDYLDLLEETVSFQKDAPKLSPDVAMQKASDIAAQYDGLNNRLTAIDCPPECTELRTYTFNMMDCSALQVVEVGMYYGTGDVEHMHKADSYYSDWQTASDQWTDEWKRLGGN